MRSNEVFLRLAAMAAEFDALLDASITTLADADLVAALAEHETLLRRQPAFRHRLIARLATEASPLELGGRNLREVLTHRLRISNAEANRWIADAEELGERRALTGEHLEPQLATTSAAQRRGEVNADHIRIIRTFMDQLPRWVDGHTRDEAEATMSAVAATVRPEHLRQAADRLMALLNQDGDEPREADRARQRYLVLSKQDADGMTDVRGRLDPEAAAALEAILAKLAAKGMCNPDDETPCVDDEPTEAREDGDTRTRGQRNHDALKAICRATLASGRLGQHNGLPVSIVVSTTLQELERGHGHAVTGGGIRIPMPALIRLASHSYHYLAVFNQHTGMPLYLGRTKRIATAAQRIVLHSKDRGCTFPDCTAAGYECQVHHIDEWAADGGHTNIDKLTFACKTHHPLIDAGWTVRKRADGRTEWIPPPGIDGGQARVNRYHHPHEYLVDPAA
jgi:hypothetical protein